MVWGWDWILSIHCYIKITCQKWSKLDQILGLWGWHVRRCEISSDITCISCSEICLHTFLCIVWTPTDLLLLPTFLQLRFCEIPLRRGQILWLDFILLFLLVHLRSVFFNFLCISVYGVRNLGIYLQLILKKPLQCHTFLQDSFLVT